MQRLRIYTALLVITILATAPLYGQQSDQKAPVSHADLAKQSQNPVGSMVSVPFQNNTSFNFGEDDGTQNILNIEPVYPVRLSESWNLIPRFIIPLVWQPVNQDTTFGLGDINATAFFVPSKAGKLIWGVGPSFLMDTATSSELGTGMWSAGPSVVVLTMPGNWVFGSLFSQLWSFTTHSGDSITYHFTELVPPSPGDPAKVNSFTWQYFVNYNLKDGWFLTSAPTMTANWEADQSWLVPIGGGVGKIFHMGKQPAKLAAQGFYNVVKPDGAASWSLQAMFVLLFPK
jgi:hypothetical protein